MNDKYWMLVVNHLEKGIPWWLGLLLCAGLFVLPNFFAAKLGVMWLQFPGLDKPTHFLAFIAVFLIAYGVLWGRMWPRGDREKLGLAVCISLGISLADEIQQAMFGMGRTAEYGDLVADAAI